MRLNDGLYRVTFPMKMGDVPSLVIISKSQIWPRPRNATEVKKGVSPFAHIAFELDGVTTDFFDFTQDVTNENLQDAFYSLFNIQCPPSLYRVADNSIKFLNEFEDGVAYDDVTVITDKAFCGRNAFSHSVAVNLFLDNTESAKFICFAYKIPINSRLSLEYEVQGDDEFYLSQRFQYDLKLIADAHWHYECFDLFEITIELEFTFSNIENFVVTFLQIKNIPDGGSIDTFTLRTSLPAGYEETREISSMDKSNVDSCSFPFVYQGQTYHKCTLDENGLPICVSASNKINYCSSSSIEGVRRIYPKYKFQTSTLSIQHIKSTRTIDVSFRYTDCNPPTLIKVLPRTVSCCLPSSTNSFH